MSKRFYAVQHGGDFDCGYGSTVKRTAIKMANKLHRDYPGEQIRIVLCREGNDYAEGEIIVHDGTID